MSKKFYLFIIIFAILFVPVFVANAQYGIDVTAGQTSIQQFKNVSLQTMVGNLLGGVLSLVGILFFALMVYGGVIWMSAAGNQEREKKAGGIMIGATIGVVLVLSSYVLVQFLFNKVGGGQSISSPATTVTTDAQIAKTETCNLKNKGAAEEYLSNVCEEYDEAECESDTGSKSTFGVGVCKVEGGSCVVGIAPEGFCKSMTVENCKSYSDLCNLETK